MKKRRETLISNWVKIIKDTIKKDIPIDCYGGMYDYFLRLKKNNIRFGIMKKALQD